MLLFWEKITSIYMIIWFEIIISIFHFSITTLLSFIYTTNRCLYWPTAKCPTPKQWLKNVVKTHTIRACSPSALAIKYLSHLITPQNTQLYQIALKGVACVGGRHGACRWWHGWVHCRRWIEWFYAGVGNESNILNFCFYCCSKMIHFNVI